MQNLGKQVKFYRRQCEYLVQKSSGAPEEIHALLGDTEIISWEQDNLAPLIYSLWSLLYVLHGGWDGITAALW